MGDNLKKVQPGDKLRVPAAAYNAFVDAAVDLRRRQQNLSIDGGGSPRQAGIIPVRNDSGEDVERFHILAIDGPLFEPEDSDDQAFKNSIVLVGVKPDENTPRGQFVIAREPIKAGAVGHPAHHPAPMAAAASAVEVQAAPADQVVTPADTLVVTPGDSQEVDHTPAAAVVQATAICTAH